MEDRTLKLLLLLALIARGGAFLLASGGGILIGEGRVYSDLAENLNEGRGFLLSGEMLYPEERAAPGRVMHARTFEFYRRVDGFYGVLRPDRPTLFIPPGYPVFMAAVYRLAGSGNLLAVRGLQLAMGMLTVLLGIRLAQRHLRGPSLTITGLFMALDPFEIYYEAIPATQALFGLLFVSALVLSTAALDRRSTILAAGSSALWGLASYVRPVAIPVMAVFALCLLLNCPGAARRIRASAAGLAVFAAVMLPWILYMHDISGQWRLTPTQGGVNLWESNGRIFSSHFEDEEQGAETLFGPLREEMSGSIRKPWLAEFPEFRDEPEWVRDSILTDRTFEFLRANPIIVPRLVLLRFAEFFKPFPFNNFPLYYMLAGLLTFGTVLVFAGAGLARFARRRDPAGLLIVLVVVVYTLVHMASISGTPHRVALDVPLAVLAGSGLSLFLTRTGLSERLGRKQPDS